MNERKICIAHKQHITITYHISHQTNARTGIIHTQTLL